MTAKARKARGIS